MSRLRSDVAMNFAGLALPLGIALIAVPVILNSAGAERLGFLTIAWAAIGYLGFLDFGISRAVARRLAAASDEAALAAETGLMFRAGTLLFWGGAVVAVVLYVLVPATWLFGAGSEQLPAAEVAPAWAVLLGTLPAILAANVWRGAMEGRRAFAPVNLYRVLLGIWTYGAPIIVLLWSRSIVWLVTAVAIGRWLSAWLHYRWCRRALPSALNGLPPNAKRELLATLKEGAWMAVSNVVGPIIVLLDRFVIAALVGLAAAATYAIPQEIALRMLLVPAAVALSVFPRFAVLPDSLSSPSVSSVPGDAARLTLALMVPASLTIIAVAYPLLRWWLGDEIAQSGGFVLQVFALSVLINAPAGIAFILLQARGCARWSAWLHLAELPVTVAVLFAAVARFGVAGAAAVWLLRIAVDAAALFWLARRIEPAFVSARLLAGLACASLGALILMATVKQGADWVMIGALTVALVAVSLAIVLEKREFTSLLPTLKLGR